MAPALPRTAGPFGRHLRHWRRVRGLSQLELGVRAEVSQRHLSFIETGRARPKADVVHRLSEALQIPIRERNTLLEAAGLPAAFPEAQLSDASISPFRAAITQLLASHEPWPAFVVDRWWNVVDANAAGRRLFDVGDGKAANVIDSFLGAGPLREAIENFPVVAWTFVRRLRHEVEEAGNDPKLSALLERAERHLEGIPPLQDEPGSDLVVCPRLRFGDRIIRTISMVARFGNARDVTLDELRVELLYPADEAAAAFLRGK